MILKKIKYLISLIVSAYLFSEIGKDVYLSNEHFEMLKNKSLLLFLLMLIFIPIFYLLTIKLIYLVSHFKKINFFRSLKATIIAYNYNLFLPAKSGDFFRYKYLDLNISFKSFFYINIVEKIISTFVLTLFVAFSFFNIKSFYIDFLHINYIYLFFMFSTLLLIALCFVNNFFNNTNFFFYKILKLLFFDFLVWLLQFLQILTIMNILDIQIQIYEMVFIFGTAIIAGLIPISIGGFGVRDYVVFYLFNYMNIEADIFIVLLLFNLRYLFPVMVNFLISLNRLRNAK